MQVQPTTGARPRGRAAIPPPEGAKAASFVLFAVLAGLVAIAYAASEWLQGGFGFPSDQAWARAVFARNVASGQGMCFNPGVPVAGVTGPAWIACLAAAGIFTGKYFFGAKLLGLAFVILAAFVTWYITLDLLRDWRFAFLAALLVAASPRLAAAGLSGTEAALAALLVTAMIHWQARGWDGTSLQRAIGVAAASLAALSRPELVLLLPVLLLDRWLTAALGGGAERGRARRALARSLPELAAATLILAPYVVFNWRNGGPLWQQPESALRAQPVWAWAGAVLGGIWGDNAVLVCAAALGLPVVLAALRRSSEHPSFALVLAPMIMVAVPGLIWRQATAGSAAYAVAYLTPVIAILAVSGLFLVHRWLKQAVMAELNLRSRLAFATALALGCGLIFGFMWAAHKDSWRQHGVRVKRISNLQAFIGRWAADHLAPDASIASREVGAIGFFSRRRMVDLGGTISQEGLAYLSRPGAPDSNLLAYLQEVRPSHLAIRPGDFPDLSQRADLLVPAVSCVDRDSRAGGVTTMTLYETPWPAPSLRPARREAISR